MTSLPVGNNLLPFTYKIYVLLSIILLLKYYINENLKEKNMPI